MTFFEFFYLFVVALPPYWTYYIDPDLTTATTISSPAPEQPTRGIYYTVGRRP